MGHDFNRRQFIAAGAGAAAVSMTGARVLGANDKVRIGCIGVGNRGGRHLNNLVEMPGVRVAAICDADPNKLKRAVGKVTGAGHPEPFATDDWNKLLQRDDVDAVVSALPCDLHKRNYIDVIGAGKDLYAEKPLAIHVDELDAIVEAEKQGDVIVQVGMQRRADPRYQGAVRQARDGTLGELLEGRIRWSNPWGPKLPAFFGWYGLRQRSGDWMVEQAVHNWDVINWATGQTPQRAMGLGRDDLYRDRQPDRTVHDYYSGTVEYPNGLIVAITHSWVPPNAFGGREERLFGRRAATDFNKGVIYSRPDADGPSRIKTFEDRPRKSATRLAMESFVETVRTRSAPVATVEMGRRAALAGILMREAVEQRKPVTMDQVLERRP